MNTDKFKQRLLAEERRLTDGVERSREGALQVDDLAVGDTADTSVNDEEKSGQFQQADMDWTLLGQVRDALKRIGEGTFGKCVVDGGPIEEKRLDAMPWTPYCIKHERSIEAAHPRKMPTL